MAVSSRALLILAAVPLLVPGYTANLGFYSPGAIGLVLAGAVLTFCAMLARPRMVRLPASAPRVMLYGPFLALMVLLLREAAFTANGMLAMLYAVMAVVGLLTAMTAHLAGLRPRDPLQAGLIGAGILLSGFAVLACQLRYPDPAALGSVLAIVALAAAGYLVWLSFLAQPVPGRGWLVRLGLLVAVGLGIRGLAVTASPDPIIDVNAWLQQAPRFLLQGRNPYAVDYASPYGTARASAAGIHDAPDPRPATYPPVAVLTGVPAVLLGLDVRYVNVAADVLAAVLLFLAARAAGRTGPGALAAGLYLCLPRTPFFLEQSWIEPQMACLAGTMLLLAGSGRGARAGTWAGAALGALLATKQYAVVFLPCLARQWGRQRGLWVAAALVFAIVVAPFALWGPGHFWEIVVTKHLARPVVPQALTLLALAKNSLALDLSPAAGWLVALALILAIAWRNPGRNAGNMACCLGASVLAFILGHKQGYFNYYVLTTYLLLWGLGVGDEGGEAHDAR
ncbi:MAG: hypothetical protein HPY69_02105 [Armatimonadetes bacterium]|nr:hypothetical protein [Armatimonadota bacterium]